MFNVCNFATKIYKMNLEKRINAFSILGLFLKQFKAEIKSKELEELNQQFYYEFDELISKQKSLNGWFDRKNVLNAVDAVGDMLTKENLYEWVNSYSIEPKEKIVGVIMAGNIPMVGFHDFLSILITGNKVKAKLSSDDNTLLRKVAEILIEIESNFSNKIEFVDRLENLDAVIATGSNNTSRYFKQYFGKYPHIIRKNRNAVAVIHKNDNKEDIEKLGKDVFTYYGLGCRNVSKLYLPKGYKLDAIFEGFYHYKEVIDNSKYANNYDYNKAVYLLGNHQLLDNNFLLLKEDTALTSPVGVLHYEFYNDINVLRDHLKEIKGDLQCIVSTKNTPIDTLGFGQAQTPELYDYADGVDTIKFILSL